MTVERGDKAQSAASTGYVVDTSSAMVVALPPNERRKKKTQSKCTDCSASGAAKLAKASLKTRNHVGTRFKRVNAVSYDWEQESDHTNQRTEECIKPATNKPTAKQRHAQVAMKPE